MSGDGAAPARLKVLFFLSSIDYDGVFESLLRAILGRGHEVLVAIDHHKGGPPRAKAQLFEQLSERFPGFNYQELRPRRDLWRIPAGAIRRSLDYLRYLDPKQDPDRANALRDRARDRAPRALRALLFLPPFRWPWGRRMLGWLLRRLEAGMPISRPLKSFIKEQAPDVALVSPLVEFGSPQAEFVRTTQAARVPSVLVVVSWDDLESTGVIRDAPTLTVTSSDEQTDEAVRLHELPRERIEAVGAQSFDGLDAPAAPSVVAAIERTAPTEVTPRREGRILRPILWLLTPLMAILLALLRPRATVRAVIRFFQRTRKRLRKRRAQRVEAKAHAAKEAKVQGKALARVAREEEKQKAREARGEEKARLRGAKGEKASKEERAVRAARAKQEGEGPKRAKPPRERSRPPIWRRKAVRGKARALRRGWKNTRRGSRRVYNRRYRFTYRRTIMRVPSRDELPALLNARGLSGKGAEIGVKQGRYSDELLGNWRGSELISIDPWLSADPEEYVDRSNVEQDEFEQYYQQTRERLERYGSRSTIWRMTSVEAAPKVPDGSLDFVYIDARHDYESVKEDLEAWCSKVRPGGILAGHDYVDGDLPEGEFYVKSAVDEFFGARDIPVHGTEGPSAVESFPTWIVEVPEDGIAPPPAKKAPEESTPAMVERAGEHSRA